LKWTESRMQKGGTNYNRDQVSGQVFSDVTAMNSMFMLVMLGALSTDWWIQDEPNSQIKRQLNAGLAMARRAELCISKMGKC
jgi:hypothetical protein